MDYPKYEKVNENTIKMIEEKITNVDIQKVLQAKTQVEGQIEALTGQLEKIREILESAKELGIDTTPKPKDKKKEKKNGDN